MASPRASGSRVDAELAAASGLTLATGRQGSGPADPALPTQQSASEARAQPDLSDNAKPGLPDTSVFFIGAEQVAPGRERPAESVFVSVIAGTSVSLAGDATGPNSPAQTQQAAEVARQIAERIAIHQGGILEITLSPEELGRLRLSMSRDGEGILVTVQAERSETLELMRRNVDLLAQDLRALGYEGATFDFGQWRGEGQPAADKGSTEQTKAEPVQSGNSLQPVRYVESGLLNLRL